MDITTEGYLISGVRYTDMDENADIVIPAFSDSIDDVQITNWLVSVGDPVDFGMPIVELEVNKSAVEVESPADGVIDAIFCWEGEEVIEGERIGVIRLVSPDEETDEKFDFKDSEKYDI